MTSSKI